MKNKIISLLLLLPFSLCSFYVKADEEENEVEDKTIVLPPLFEFPVASEELDWNDRSDWLVSHFWEPFDFKQSAVGQHQLNHAFSTWMVPMRYAALPTIFASVDNLIKKLEKNPTLLLQFTRAAEYAIYDPETAELWIDPVYMKFIEALKSNKKISQTYKTKYGRQLTTLENSKVGYPVAPFKFTSRSGEKLTFAPSGKITLVEFGNPECPDCQMARIAIKRDDTISNLFNEGLLDIYFIIPDIDESDLTWTQEVMDYPDNWIVGASDDVSDILDIRVSPCIYLFDSEGRLLLKNVHLNDVITTLKQVEMSKNQETPISELE